jgi:hypothetical protein
MDRQVLRDHVHRYNVEGLAGLRSRKPLGPFAKLTARQEAELAVLVEAGPDPVRHGVVRWRGLICATRLNDASASHWTSVRSARCSPSLAITASREAAQEAFKKLCRDPCGSSPPSEELDIPICRGPPRPTSSERLIMLIKAKPTSLYERQQGPATLDEVGPQLTY